MVSKDVAIIIKLMDMYYRDGLDIEIPYRCVHYLAYLFKAVYPHNDYDFLYDASNIKSSNIDDLIDNELIKKNKVLLIESNEKKDDNYFYPLSKDIIDEAETSINSAGHKKSDIRIALKMMNNVLDGWCTLNGLMLLSVAYYFITKYSKDNKIILDDVVFGFYRYGGEHRKFYIKQIETSVWHIKKEIMPFLSIK